MSGPHDVRLAQLAYRAHNRALGAEAELPAWNELPPRVQTAWEVAAEIIWRNALRAARPASLAGHLPPPPDLKLRPHDPPPEAA